MRVHVISLSFSVLPRNMCIIIITTNVMLSIQLVQEGDRLFNASLS